MGAYTVSMRVYIPALLSDLSVPLPPVRAGVVAVPDGAMSGEDVEVLEVSRNDHCSAPQRVDGNRGRAAVRRLRSDVNILDRRRLR